MRAQISKWFEEGGMLLIKKERKKPFKLQMEEVLAKRLSPTHQPLNDSQGQHRTRPYFSKGSPR
jgi:hypothetical protein